MYGINRIRLEFKERWVARSQGYVKVLIESDWNLKESEVLCFLMNCLSVLIESDWNLKNGDSMVLHPELFTY